MSAPERKCLAILYRQSLQSDTLRGIRVAEELSVSRAFISRIMNQLKEKQALRSTEPLVFTEEGKRLAKIEYTRAEFISAFLVKNLNSTDEIAWIDGLNVMCALSPRNLRALDFQIRRQETAGGQE